MVRPHKQFRLLQALSVAAVLIFCWTEPVWAQSAELMEAYNEYKELNEQGRYEEAIP